MVHLDSSATSSLLPEARDAILDVLNLSVSRALGNPSSLHSSGVRAKTIIADAKKSVARLLSCRESELIFTSGGTEANNTVLHIFNGTPVLVSKIEHPSVLAPAKAYGSPCFFVPVDRQGIIDLKFVDSTLSSILKTTPSAKVLLSVMTANNETGVLEPIKELLSLRDKYRALKLKVFLHTDATQAIAKIPLSLKTLPIDYLTFSAHKIGGPVGLGVLFTLQNAPFSPLLLGGAQESRRRTGTENAALAAGLAAAADYCFKNQTWNLYESKVRPLKNYLIQKLTPLGVSFNTPTTPSLPNVLNFSIPACEGESTQLYLDLDHIEVSTGSACASGDLEPSHVLMALHGDAEVAHNSIRLSLDLRTTKNDLDLLLEKLPPIISRLTDLSTIKPKSNPQTKAKQPSKPKDSYA
ncbi:cysteine desulfurase [Candidatus Saccharibacteria bacterium]|nr:cysteine desulfurase [Candidatus Saccharibacteria bacterium]